MILDRGDLQDALAKTHFEPNDVERGEAIVLRSFRAISHVLKGDPLLGLRIASDTRVDAVAPELAMFRAEADHALMFALQALDEHARAIELAVECEQLGRDNDAPELVARALPQTAYRSECSVGTTQPSTSCRPLSRCLRRMDLLSPARCMRNTRC